MSVPGGRPVLDCVNAPVAVPPSTMQFVIGDGEVPQHVPRAVMAAPPSDVIVASRVADVLVIAVAVGEITAGKAAAIVIDVPMLDVPAFASATVTEPPKVPTAFGVPVIKPLVLMVRLGVPVGNPDAVQTLDPAPPVDVI